MEICFCISVNYVGIIPPSDGKAEIFGYDLSSQIDLVRPSIGFCPQTSILYDQLTVYEHLYILATVKDQSSQSILFENLSNKRLFVFFLKDKRLRKR